MEKYTVEVDNAGTIRWYKDGTNILHRLDGPAVEYTNGTKVWQKDGEYHREDGPACEYADGTKYWYKNGKFHRDKGPACEYPNGDKFWYRNGKLHREDGPAIEYAHGSKFWYLEWTRYTEAEFNKLIQKKLPKPTCDGKEVIIEGKKYILSLVDKA